MAALRRSYPYILIIDTFRRGWQITYIVMRWSETDAGGANKVVVDTKASEE